MNTRATILKLLALGFMTEAEAFKVSGRTPLAQKKWLASRCRRYRVNPEPPTPPANIALIAPSFRRAA